ncbi:MAG: hypothetical protein ACXV3F_00280 [Frankiaceae bacterium]
MAENKPAPKAEENQSVGVRDRVVMASRKSDGVTPAQSEEWEFIGPKDAAKQGARHQHVSAALANLEPVSLDGPFPSAEEREKAVEPAEKRADAEVEKFHRGFGDNEG